jgi:hypothetical protein
MDIQILINTVAGIIVIFFGYFFNKKIEGLKKDWNYNTEVSKTHWAKFSEIELKERSLAEKKYSSALIFMSYIANPDNTRQFNIDNPHLNSLKSQEEILKYAKTKLIELYYDAFLYASDDVLKKIKQFIDNPTQSNFMQTAISIRKDFRKPVKTEITEIDYALNNTSL